MGTRGFIWALMVVLGVCGRWDHSGSRGLEPRGRRVHLGSQEFTRARLGFARVRVGLFGRS